MNFPFLKFENNTNAIYLYFCESMYIEMFFKYNKETKYILFAFNLWHTVKNVQKYSITSLIVCF